MTHGIESFIMISNNAPKLVQVKRKTFWYIADFKDNTSDLENLMNLF